MTYLIIIAIGVFFTLFWLRNRPDASVLVSTNDERYLAAVAQARASLPLFLEHTLDKKGHSTEGATIKIRFDVPELENSGEQVWATPFRRLKDDRFEVTIINRPSQLTEIGEGSVVTVDYDQITDWSLISSEDGQVWGGYTMRVMLTDGVRAPRGARQITDRLTENPIPPDWRRL